ncbi:MAG: hypothetical protein O2783_02145 [Chloroflexi bacterium]|nr:hypothetical protein [Chloroflexota bacterium]
MEDKLEKSFKMAACTQKPYATRGQRLRERGWRRSGFAAPPPDAHGDERG